MEEEPQILLFALLTFSKSVTAFLYATYIQISSAIQSSPGKVKQERFQEGNMVWNQKVSPPRKM